MIYRFRKDGTLELAGPAGVRGCPICKSLPKADAGLIFATQVNAMQALIQTMVDQLGAMERVVR